MADTSKQPLRGDAAYRAFKAQVAKNNDAAQRRGRERRAAADAVVAERQAAAERRELDDLPVQPEP
jgi:hypothetical protein